MAFILRAIALISFLLFARPVQAQDAFTTRIEIGTDTEDQHFEDYWRRANDALLTPDGRQRLDRGHTRLSLRSMSNPARYGLVLPAHADEVVTAADLLCSNRETNSLQLRCRMPGASHSRRVRLTDTACAGRPDLFTLIPDGCERVYVMTVEGREVTTSQLVATPRPPSEVVPPPTPVTVANSPTAEPSSTPSEETVRLHREVRDLKDERRDLREELRGSERGLTRAYVAIALLVLLVIGVAAILWKQRRKIDEHVGTQAVLATHVRTLSEVSAQATLKGLERESTLRGEFTRYTQGMRAEAAAYVGALFQRNLALERELQVAQERPSVVIDESVFRLEELEQNAAESERKLREAQDLERQTLQNRIDELTKTNARLAGERSQIDQANRRLRQGNLALRSLIDQGRVYLEGLGLDPPTWFASPPIDPLTVPPPPNTRSIADAPRDERRTLTGIGSDPPPPAGASTPPPEPQGPGGLTPSLVDELRARVEETMSDRWAQQPTLPDTHPPLSTSEPERTGFWELQEDGSVRPLTPPPQPPEPTDKSPTDVDVLRGQTREVDASEQGKILHEAALTPSQIPS